MLFIATCCVMILLMVENEEKRRKLKLDDYGLEPLEDTVLKTVAKVVCPVIFFIWDLYHLKRAPVTGGRVLRGRGDRRGDDPLCGVFRVSQDPEVLQ